MSQILQMLLLMLLAGSGPKVDVELLHTPVEQKGVDLFLVVYNPNPYSIEIPRNPCSSQVTNIPESGSGEIVHVNCGAHWEYPRDFVQLESKQKMIFPILSDFRVESGDNSITVEFSDVLDPSSNIPDENNVVLEYRKLRVLVTREE